MDAVAYYIPQFTANVGKKWQKIKFSYIYNYTLLLIMFFPKKCITFAKYLDK